MDFRHSTRFSLTRGKHLIGGPIGLGRRIIIGLRDLRARLPKLIRLRVRTWLDQGGHRRPDRCSLYRG